MTADTTATPTSTAVQPSTTPVLPTTSSALHTTTFVPRSSTSTRPTSTSVLPSSASALPPSASAHHSPAHHSSPAHDAHKRERRKGGLPNGVGQSLPCGALKDGMDGAASLQLDAILDDTLAEHARGHKLLESIGHGVEHALPDVVGPDV